MNGNGDAVTATPGARPRSRVVGRLPKIAVTSRAALADVLRKWRWLLNKRAVLKLGDTPAAREAVRGTVVKLLETDPSHYPPHVLRWALVTLYNECRAVQVRLERQDELARRVREAGGPVDPVLGALVGPVGQAVNGLSAPDKQVLLLAAEGLHPSDIAVLLDSSARTISQRLYRARKRVRETMRGSGDPMATQALWPLAFQAAPCQGARGPRRTLFLLNRALGSVLAAPRTLLDRLATYAPGDASISVVMTVIVGALVAGQPASPSPHGPELAAVQPTQGSNSPPLGMMAQASRALADAPPPGEALARLHITTPTTPDSRADLPSRSPGSETPDDAQIVSVSPSPNYQQDHTIVALGLAKGCACPVLLRSLDGGNSWEATLQAAIGSQVLLPPAYPRDPRIFIGQSPGATRPDWVSGGWGMPFTPLPLPPGRLGLVGSTVLSISTTGVWGLKGALLSPIATYQAGGSAAITSDGATAYVVVPAHSVLAGAVIAAETSLLACATDCRLVGPVPVDTVGQIASSGPVLMVTGNRTAMVSRDAGTTFTDVTPVSASKGAIRSVAATSHSLWSVVGSPRGQVLRYSGAWSPAPVATADVGAVVAISDTRLIALLASGAFLCSADSGQTWAPRCPVEE
jgi:DNA-directed RNA polymerase specialized sigma24 family protein